jgi:hypothetical protein
MHDIRPLVRWVLALALVIPTSAISATGGQDLDAIRAQQKEIRTAALTGTGIYARLTASERDGLLAKQDRLLALIDGKKAADDLNEADRIEAFNALEWIEAAINPKDDEGMVCHRERKVGSNRITQVCRTAADDKRLREEARQRMDDAQRRN